MKGDSLFVGGCGRFFEGSAKEMFAWFRRLEKLPRDTVLFGGHEYTVSNLEFAERMAPDNARVGEKLAWARKQREKRHPTVPSTLAEELAYNLFLQCATPQDLALLRGLKDGSVLPSPP